MTKTTELKRSDFARIFCPRVEKLQKMMELLANCSNRSNYAWTDELIARTWIEIGKTLRTVAKEFGVDFQVTVQGVSVNDFDTTKALTAKDQQALF